MVIQRGKPIVLFGTAEPNKNFIVRINGNESIVKSDSEGNWITIMDPLPIGGLYDCKIIYEKDLILHRKIK